MSIPALSHIVFQAYGNRGILQECVFALLSLCRHHNKQELEDLEIWIYTDNPEYFASFKGCWLNIHFKEVTPSLLKEWRGSIDFVHRVKVCILQDFVKNRRGQILYLDTDVCFLAPVTEVFRNIAAGQKYMHIKEGLLHGSDNILFKKISRFIKRRNSVLAVNGKTIFIPPDTAMWNAGLLGFPADQEELLKLVLAFTDSIYKEFPKHIVEQYAFSIYFNLSAPVQSAHTFVFHYWNLKELRSILQSFFQRFEDKNWDELVRLSKLIEVPDLVQQKFAYNANRSFASKLMKKKWVPLLPDWELLTKQM